MIKTTKETSKNDQKVGQIMGINVSITQLDRVLAAIEQKISCSSRFSIVTPNPELILMTQKNPLLKNALNSADFPIPDGVGLKLAIPGLNIIKGRELFLELIKLADKKGWRVFLLGGLDDEAEAASRNLQISNPKLKIQYDKYVKLDKFAEPVTKVDIKLQKDAIDKINKFAPQLLFVAFGNPKQEIWIHKNLSRLNIGGAMAVGGTFRYVAGLTKLPPDLLASLGLEWLWRAVHEPKRIKRIWNAVVVFPLKVFLTKL